jgi:hypothetical protein
MQFGELWYIVTHEGIVQAGAESTVCRRESLNDEGVFDGPTWRLRTVSILLAYIR